MNNFKVTKCKKYFQTHILKFKPGNVTVDVHLNTMQLHQDRASTEKYMKLILDMEQAVKKELDTRGLNHDPMKIIVFRLNLVSSWAANFDIRHDLPIEHQAMLLVNWYDNAYNEAKEDCEKVLSGLKENPIPYIKNWAAHDKYDRQNKLFELGMEDLKDYFGEDPLDKVIELSKQMLDTLIKNSKEKKETNSEK